jgi:aryl-alcohol dehydrogenase-like predicted oxidoreductase
METTMIGGTLEIRRIGLGTVGTVGPGFLGRAPDPDGAAAVLRRAVALGVNLIDTADAYGPGFSEELIAEALAPYPPALVIATKGGSTRPGGPADWGHDGRPEYLRNACEASLRRLRLEALPLYQLHSPDARTPFAESVGALRGLQQQGKIQHIGISNVTVEQLDEACSVCDVATVQCPYSVGDRTNEDLVDACERRGITFLAYYPLASGRLDELGDAVREVAAQIGATTGQVALAWLLRRSPAIVPIPGTGSAAHLEENVAAGAVSLSDEQYARLDHRQ